MLELGRDLPVAEALPLVEAAMRRVPGLRARSRLTGMTPLPHSTYVSLTTFRRTGVAVATPVWAAPDGDVADRLDPGRLRKGQAAAPHVAGDGRALRRPRSGRRAPPSTASRSSSITTDWPQALAALRRTYGLRFTLGHHTARLWHRLMRAARRAARTPAHRTGVSRGRINQL